MKVTVVGVGNVGATVANVVALKGFARELVLLNTRGRISEGKALDMTMTSQVMNFNTKIVGCKNDYKKTANSKVVIITAGVPRKPGMTREQLIGTNAGIVKSVVEKVHEYSPEAIYIIIANPMDTMTYLTFKYLAKSGVPRNRIIGMGGMLDSGRFKYYLSKALGCIPIEVNGMVIGGHGDSIMIPLVRFATYKGIPVTQLLDKETLDKVVADTMAGGATLTGLLGTSAWYAPGAAGATVAEAIATDAKKLIPCSVYLEGEYGENDICIGVPVVLGATGIEKILDVKLNAEEQALFDKSVAAVRNTNALLASVL